jgi:nitrogen regulatory protein PII
MKKLEIIIEAVEKKSVLKILNEVGANGYTIINDIHGQGKQGTRRGSELTNIMRNSLIIVVDDYDKIQTVIGKVKEILEIYSGIMFLSDVEVIN